MKSLLITFSILLITVLAFQPNAEARKHVKRGIAKELPPYRGLASESHHKHKKDKKHTKHAKHESKKKKNHKIAKSKHGKHKVAKVKQHKRKHDSHDSEYVLHPVFE